MVTAAGFGCGQRLLNGPVSIRLGDGLGGFSGSPNVRALRPDSVAIGDPMGTASRDLAVPTIRSVTASIRLVDGSDGLSGSTREVSVGLALVQARDRRF